jgi:hypothetical protein
MDLLNPASIRRRLILRRVLDPFLGGFGAASHRYRLNPPLEPAELAAFEARHRVELPADYRRFLLESGNGGAGPDYGLRALDDDLVMSDLAQPFGLTHAWNEGGAEGEMPEAHRQGCLVLGAIGCGYFSFLVVTGPARGEVWQDFTAGDGGLQPTGHSFETWYWSWL